MHFNLHRLPLLIAGLLFVCTPLKLLSKSNDLPTTMSKPMFIKNIGQVTDEYRNARGDIDYKIPGGNINIFIGRKGLQYQWCKRNTVTASEPIAENGRPKLPEPYTVTMHSVWVKLIGHNTRAEVIAEQPQAYYENYYLDYCKGTAHSFGKITYKNIYPYIDWVLYADGSNSNGIKYDFIVHPGGKVSDIKMQYEGAESLRLENGSLQALAALGNIVEEQPYTFNAITKQPLSSAFMLKDNVLSFDVAAYDDRSNTIVIDPIINWGTYYGAPGKGVYGTVVASDTSGNSFLCGYTDETANIATLLNSHQPFKAGALDAYIVQFSQQGNARKWATYYGGDGTEAIFGAVTDAAGSLYITGSTNSKTGISTTGVHQEVNGGSHVSANDLNDGFLTKFSNNGYLQWGTFIGGPNSEWSFAVGVQGNSVYAGGNTTGKDSIATTGAFQTTQGDGFLLKYNATNGTKQWGTYFNGSIAAIAVDCRNNLYIGGSTVSYTNVGTPGTHSPAYGGGNFDGFIAKFRSNGARAWGTYYGGTGAGQDNVNGLVCDSLGNIYIGGVTALNTTGIATAGAHLTTATGLTGACGFLAKLDSFGVRKWGTYYPGRVYSMALGPDNKIYAGGTSYELTGIATPGAHQSSFGGPPYPPMFPNGSDGFLAKFNNDGKRLNGTYYGGEQDEKYITISYGAGMIYLGGTTYSKSMIAFGTGYQNTMDTATGVFLGYMGQFQGDTSVYFKFPYIDTLLCAGGPLKVVYGVTNKFTGSNVFTVQLSDASGSFGSAVNIGSLNYNDRGEIACTIPANTPPGTGYKLRIIASSPRDTFYNYDMPSRVSTYHIPDAVALLPICANLNLSMMDANGPAPAGTQYTWISPNPSRAPGLFNPNLVTAITLADSGDYIAVANNHGCIGKDTVHIHVTVAPPEPTVSGDTSLCYGDSLHLELHSPVPGVKYAWFHADGSFGQYDSLVKEYNVGPAHAGKYRVSAELDGCQSDPLYGQLVTVHPLPYVNVNINTPLCAGDTLKLFSSDTMAGVSYSWSGPQGFSYNRKDTVIKSTTPSLNGVYTVITTTVHGCKDTASATVTVKPMPNAMEAKANSPVCTGNELQLGVDNPTMGATYSWSGPGGYSSSQQSPVITDTRTDQSGIYKVIVNLDGCAREDTTRADIYPTPPKPRLSSNSPLTTGATLTIKVENEQAGATYSWTGPNSYTTTAVSPVLNSVVPAMSGVYTVKVTDGLCSSSDTISIQVTDAPGGGPYKAFVLFPNPNRGVFKIVGTTKTEQAVEIGVFASDGKEVYKGSVQPVNKAVDATIDIGGVANGIYRLKLRVDGEKVVISFTVKQ